ncbi:hypothetical protein [Sutcliffiella deserti]|uniref:hypothetical protein n=1 Tax=Sutcliffiella deserti TaxID=2875501 RepID=UPI001CBB9022|nr:hypothetical protein [Sutcliffiella deserti]
MWMIIRKFVSALIACFIILIPLALMETVGFSFFIGIYLLPILLVIGVPVSILSDLATNRCLGWRRRSFAWMIHVIGAALFVFLLLLLFEPNRMYMDPASLYQNVLFYTAMVASTFFWCADECLNWHKIPKILQRIGDMRI